MLSSGLSGLEISRGVLGIEIEIHRSCLLSGLFVLGSPDPDVSRQSKFQFHREKHQGFLWESNVVSRAIVVFRRVIDGQNDGIGYIGRLGIQSNPSSDP